MCDRIRYLQKLFNFIFMRNFSYSSLKLYINMQNKYVFGCHHTDTVILETYIITNPLGFIPVILILLFLNQHIDNDSMHRVCLKGLYSSNHLSNSIPADLIMPNKLYAAKKGNPSSVWNRCERGGKRWGFYEVGWRLSRQNIAASILSKTNRCRIPIVY